MKHWKTGKIVLSGNSEEFVQSFIGVNEIKERENEYLQKS